MKPCSVEGCTRAQNTRGYCSMHYARLRRKGELGPPEPLQQRWLDPRERVLGRVWIAESGCWLWQGRIDRAGYGRLGGSDHYGGPLAHRVSYTLLVGPIPEGLTIDHLCRVTSCVNPSHLEPVSMRENLLRSPLTWGGRNVRKTHCKHGHPFDEENTYWRRSGGRHCKTCTKERGELYRRRVRAAKAVSA